MDGRTDADLVAAARSGDRAAFAAIYDRYGDSLHDFCHAQTRNAADAADAFGDAMLSAFEHLAQLRDPAKLRPWLYSIARRSVLDQVRRTSRVDVSDDIEVAGGDLAGDGVSTNEVAALVWDAAAGLEARDQVVLDLAIRQDLRGEDLALALEIDRGHADTLLHNAKKRLGRCVSALLVARHGRRDCPELARILDGWDGALDGPLRNRINRHADACEICQRSHATVTDPARLLGVIPLVAAPAALREVVLADAASAAVATASVGGGGALVAKAAVVCALVGGGSAAAYVAIDDEATPTDAQPPAEVVVDTAVDPSTPPTESTLVSVTATTTPTTTTEAGPLVEDCDAVIAIITAVPPMGETAAEIEAHITGVLAAFEQLLAEDGLRDDLRAELVDESTLHAARAELVENAGYSQDAVDTHWVAGQPSFVPELIAFCLAGD